VKTALKSINIWRSYR